MLVLAVLIGMYIVAIAYTVYSCHKERNSTKYSLEYIEERIRENEALINEYRNDKNYSQLMIYQDMLDFWLDQKDIYNKKGKKI